MDTIEITGLVVHAYHGVFEEEKKLGQRFIINIKMQLDALEAAKTGDLNKTIHYGLVAERANEIFTKEKYDLIETAAQKLADKLIEEFNQIKTIEVEIEKPWAPVKLIVDTIKVKFSRTWENVFIATGSNRGDTIKNIEKAIEMIKNETSFRNVKSSTLISSKPWGGVEQDDFTNGAIMCQTYLRPNELLEKLKEFEEEIGRIKTVKWGPREIDLDIIFYSNEIINTEKLTIPHPYIKERCFVLEPICELYPHFIHPVYKKSVRELYDELKEVERNITNL